MNYSIIIPTCNRQRDLTLAIDSILRQSAPPLEIIIIDQSDNSYTKDYFDEIRNKNKTKINFVYIFQAEKSSAKARNKGIDIAQGDIISFLDDDVVLFEDYYEKVLCCFNDDEKIGGMSGRVIEKNFHSWGMRLLLKVFLLDNFDGKITASGFGFPMSARRFDRPMRVEMLMGCNMNFRKEFLKNDKFDEWFTGYSYREDVDISYRISRKTVLMTIPEAKVYHNNSRSNRMDIQDRKIMEIKNYYYFYKKHVKKTMTSDFLFLYSLLGLSIIYFKEYLFNFNEEKYKQFKGFIQGTIEILKYKKNPLEK